MRIGQFKIQNSKFKTVSAFTLIEILTVLAIIMVLMAITLWYVVAGRATTKLKAARTYASVIQSSIERYHDTFGEWPDRRLPDPKGALKNFEIVRLLRNWKIDKLLADASGRNTRVTRDPMLDKLDASQLDANDNWRDPWGSAYAISTVPDDVWKVYQKLAAAPAGSPPSLTPEETEAIQAYGATQDHALYWLKIVRSQIDVYSLGPDKACDWGYSFGDGSGYVKAPWSYCNGADNDSTPKNKRGDDVRSGGQ